MSARKHIVLVTAWFHPQNVVAAFRLNAFAKYLNKEKYKVTVIANRASERDPKQEQWQGCTVFREQSSGAFKRRRQKTTDNWFIHKLKSVNNTLISAMQRSDLPGWSKRVSRRLEHINKSEPVDLVISSYAPLDAHIAAHAFLSAEPNVKWIGDMRDEMSTNPYISSARRQKGKEFEKILARRADGLTTVSKPILEEFRSALNNEKILFKEIRNGYDHDVDPNTNFNEVFTMLYSGTFYGDHKPNTLFTALCKLKEGGELGPWKLQLLGTHRNFEIPSTIAENLEFLPRVNNSEAIQAMANSDCNVLIHPSGGRKGVYTGKLFEYVSVQKPILAVVDSKDVAADLIREQHAGEVAEFGNVEEICVAIRSIHRRWKDRSILPFDREKVKSLHRKHQVALLEQVIDELLENAESPS